MLTPSFFTLIAERPEKIPELCIIVDTEEEFDWGAPFARENVSVTAIPETARLQKVAGAYGLKPTYVVDYPVAATPSSADVLAGFAASGECCIGAHLHPWVTPPFDEPVTREMSFACNVGIDLERAKVETLTAMIVERLAVRPRVYKAGRYGFGRSTAAILESLGYDVDTSVIPHMDFSSEKGPDFRGFSPRPGVFGSSRRLLELPCTLDYVGALRRVGGRIHQAASGRFLEPLRAVGILSRTGLLNKVMLSPEGNTLDQMKALTRSLLADGVRTFALTLHSPSLKPGCTAYARNAAERDAFVATIDRYCEYFFADLGGRPTAAGDVFDALANSHFHGSL